LILAIAVFSCQLTGKFANPLSHSFRAYLSFNFITNASSIGKR
jgi:hypothetical protein